MPDALGEANGVSEWTCPLPHRDYDRVQLGHGGGGQMSAELLDHLILPGLGVDEPKLLHDAATLARPAHRLAFSTDSFVVAPLVFPGGCIGDLAVHGTINDLAMAGARPLALSVGLILEEGLELEMLDHVVRAAGAAAARAGVPIVTGDTKVVEAGSGDGIYVNTAGIGEIPDGVEIGPRRAEPGDVVLVSAPLGAHGMAVMSKREGLEFGTALRSDTAPLHDLVASMLAADPDLHVLRDATRGGVAASLCEIASAADVGIEFDEERLPIPDDVASACAFLGIDPLGVANEGVLVAIVAPATASEVLAAMTAHARGRHARSIGTVTTRHPGMVVARTAFGVDRVVDLPLGEALPRIC